MPAVEARTGAAVLLVAGSVCSGSVSARHWGSRAQVAAGESGSAGGEGNEVNLKSQIPPPPPPYYKGSGKLICHRG